MKNIENYKRCNTCEIVKPLIEFGKNKRMKDGYKNQCLECRRNNVVKAKEIIPDGFKKCGCCKDIKPFSEFNIDKHTKTRFASYCKKCTDEKNKIKYRKTHVLKIKEILPEGYKRCSKCKDVKLKECFGLNNNTKDGLKYSCRECRNNDYNKENRRKYINAWTNEYNNKNPHKIAWRNLLKHSLERLGKKKENSTIKLLGYSAIELKKLIETLFTEGMSWENYGEWHIDHIKAVSRFDKNTPSSVVNSLDNLQPLWATSRWINGVFYIGNLNKNNKDII